MTIAEDAVLARLASRSARIDFSHTVCSRRAGSVPVSAMWMWLSTPRPFPITAIDTHDPDEDEQVDPERRLADESAICDASQSQNTGTPSHIRTLPTAMSRTRSAATGAAAVRMARFRMRRGGR